MTWIYLAEDKKNALMNLEVLQNARMAITIWGPVSFSERILFI
jgi:hypothetical protein